MPAHSTTIFGLVRSATWRLQPMLEFARYRKATRMLSLEDQATTRRRKKGILSGVKKVAKSVKKVAKSVASKIEKAAMNKIIDLAVEPFLSKLKLEGKFTCGWMYTQVDKLIQSMMNAMPALKVPSYNNRHVSHRTASASL